MRASSPRPESGEGLGVRADFPRLFRSLIVESTVPAWIPPAIPWEQVERKLKKKVPARAKQIRGKLNVPRERFRLADDGQYLWAGKATR